MTRDDIIRMAREAGFEEFILDEVDGVPIYELVESKVVFERFANLVAAAEREACAQTVASIAGDEQYRWAALAIRERGAP